LDVCRLESTLTARFIRWFEKSSEDYGANGSSTFRGMYTDYAFRASSPFSYLMSCHVATVAPVARAVSMVAHDQQLRQQATIGDKPCDSLVQPTERTLQQTLQHHQDVVEKPQPSPSLTPSAAASHGGAASSIV
jgi:hypothetical protein